ncbi:hypothetical protein BPO_1343 [Bergeyella porcorum]|uniref:Uroporphyrinogen decarboxylase (URO-D) domain-containing protein n=1 Tax=Bergeyella porcorum TaxID=1735111 RepID=A0AAU0F1M8_9FLAO
MLVCIRRNGISLKAAALGVDWTITPEMARQLTHNSITLQGNFDPARLHSSPETIKKMVTEMINRFGKDRYIANLGHGILPNIPVEKCRSLCTSRGRMESVEI